VNKALKGFARVHLAPGEKKTVRVGLPWEAFQIVDAEGRSVVEPGEFEVLAGPSSRDRDLLKTTLRAE
jgi:beta-glucosidase